MAVHRKLRLVLITEALVRPYLEYACAVWAPYTAHDNDLLESVQNRAARWVGSFWDPSALRWSKSSAICVGAGIGVAFSQSTPYLFFHLDTLLYFT